MTTNTQKKIGLVVEDSGMKCAYNAGILDAFLDEGITFDYCTGTLIAVMWCTTTT